MTVLAWDKIGERTYQTGVDHGVLYLQDGSAVVWNGLTSVEETSNAELKSYYLEGIKFLNNVVPNDYAGKLKAFTYPEEFDQIMGIVDVAPGLSFYDQPGEGFNLSYQTKVGNDLDGTDHGYKIHILYNLVAVPDTYVFDSLKDTALQPIEFGWTLTGTPPAIIGAKPTVHISIDSGDTPPDVFQILEDVLYGTDTSNPRLPSIQEIASWFGYLGSLIIIDNGDGTWTAIDESNTYITMLNDTTFQIDGADATYLDASTYTISTTNAD